MPTRTAITLGALLLTACGHGPGTYADAGPVVRVSEDSAHDRYDPSRPSRTGVTLDDILASRCGIAERETFFAFDSTAVADGAKAVLDELAHCVTDGKLAGRELQLIGHADPRGSDAYNMQLGLSRAEAVAHCLRGYGVPANGIEINSVGESGAKPSDPFEWPLDRRVEIRLKDVEAGPTRD